MGLLLWPCSKRLLNAISAAPALQTLRLHSMLVSCWLELASRELCVPHEGCSWHISPAAPRRHGFLVHAWRQPCACQHSGPRKRGVLELAEREQQLLPHSVDRC